MEEDAEILRLLRIVDLGRREAPDGQ